MARNSDNVTSSINSDAHPIFVLILPGTLFLYPFPFHSPDYFISLSSSYQRPVAIGSSTSLSPPAFLPPAEEFLWSNQRQNLGLFRFRVGVCCGLVGRLLLGVSVAGMGAWCTKDAVHGGGCSRDEEVGFEEDDAEVLKGDGCSTVRLQGSSSFISMYTQQGRKGINQDAITVWENFTGEDDMFFCGVFDGHGPHGHHVARHVRNNLPLKVSKAMQLFPVKHLEDSDDNGSNPFFSSSEAILEQSFREMDGELGRDSTIDCFCSGTTAVTVIKQGNRLIIANLGDSRAVLGSRGNKNKLFARQLSVDLKPDVPSEAERIKNCRGRIFSVKDEPGVYRIWMPDEDCPGLAMARAFGDFCVKDYGLIATPQVHYRTLTDKDEFVILATDGIWDVFSNAEAIRIVASAKKRSKAAKLLVSKAVSAWKSNYPGSKIDDCGVICLFLKNPPPSTESSRELKPQEAISISRSFARGSERETAGGSKGGGGGGGARTGREWSALEGLSRVNSLLRLPRFARALSRRKIERRPESH